MRSPHSYTSCVPPLQWLVRPMLEQNGWDHDTGYDGFQVEKTAVLANKVPTSFSGQVRGEGGREWREWREGIPVG